MKMRAKMIVQSGSITKYKGHTPQELSTQLRLIAVSEKPFDENGVSEDNDFARYTPSATLDIVITNPDLVDAFHDGQVFYVDFTEVEPKDPTATKDRSHPSYSEVVIPPEIANEVVPNPVTDATKWAKECRQAGSNSQEDSKQ